MESDKCVWWVVILSLVVLVVLSVPKCLSPNARPHFSYLGPRACLHCSSNNCTLFDDRELIYSFVETQNAVVHNLEDEIYNLGLNVECLTRLAFHLLAIS